MERYSIFGETGPGPAAAAAPAENKPAETAGAAKQALRFPAEDSGKSLAAMAERDLHAALQLLAERAQYITGASGAAVALIDGGEMICRASAGPSAPKVGSELQVQSGLTGASVRLKKVLRCDDTEQDPRVNREGCRALGIRSVMVTPLLRESDVFGVFELLADRTGAFEERDVTALAQLSQMVLTALEYAEAAQRAADEIAARSEDMVRSELSTRNADAATNPANVAIPLTSDSQSRPEAAEAQGSSAATAAKVRGCEVCGFPVSEGRTICVDCDAQRRSAGSPEAASSAASDYLAQLNGPVRNESWFERHMYTIGTVVMVALTMLALALKFR